MYHRERDEICKLIIEKLNEFGIQADLKNGQIDYIGDDYIIPECSALYLLRHGETLGIKDNKFMSDESENSKLTSVGKRKVIEIVDQIEKIKFDYIMYSNLPRVKETSDIIRAHIQDKVSFLEIPWMVGINNAGWEGKNNTELEGMDAVDFYEREVLHNIFATSSRGCCWGEVLCRCIKLIEYINEKYKEKRILLISQGSISIGLQIILHMNKHPWEKYDFENFFALKRLGEHDYGKLQCIYKRNYSD